jgi:hypothetical protein
MAGSFHEFVIEGPRGWTVGFLQGYVRGRMPQAVAIDAEAEGCDVSSAGEKIRELVSRRSEIAHVLVRNDTLDVFREAIEVAASAGEDLHVELERPIDSASFEFSFETFSREGALRIQGYLKPMPEGVQLSADSHVEQFVDPDASGAEVYAPTHDFVFRGKGSLLGDVEQVIRLHRVFDDDEWVDAGPLRLREG